MSEYNLRYPVSQKSTYKSGDNVEFVLSFPGQSLVGNSVKISGKLDVYSTGTTRLVNERVYYDHLCGVHSFINNVVVSTQLKGVIENQTIYTRWVKMKNSATKATSQVISDAKCLNQLLCADYKQTTFLMNQQLPFSIDLDCCLNNVVAGSAIPYSKTGDVNIAFRVVQALEALFGEDVNGNVNFTLSDLACEYITVPVDNKATTTMLCSHQIKQIINSVNSVVNVKIPAVVSRVSCSFMKVSEELTMPNNNTELERPLGVYKLYYTFNDNTNTLVSFPIETQEDMLEHYLDSFVRNDIKNSATLKKINDNKFFGIGLYFEDFISLDSTAFGLNLLSQVKSSDPYYIYMYFKGISEL
jgi:hypothetical protein